MLSNLHMQQLQLHMRVTCERLAGKKGVTRLQLVSQSQASNSLMTRKTLTSDSRVTRTRK